jgi:hypothetical protein
MQTVREEAQVIEISQNGFNSSFNGKTIGKDQAKRLKISEFKCWTASFAVISLLTGALIYLKVGVTMETITTSLFFLSLGGLIYSVYQLIHLSRTPRTYSHSNVHQLN